jgi:hypothetical protein
MSGLVFLVEQSAKGLYLFWAGILLLFPLRGLMNSRRKLRLAEFELEREQALREHASAITWIFGIAEVMLAIYAIANVVAPTIRSDVIAGSNVGPSEFVDVPLITSTPGGDGSAVNDLGTPIGNDSIGAMLLTVTTAAAAGDGGPQIIITPTVSPTPVGTIVPGMPTPIGCTSPDASLEVPANGQVIFDSLTVIGTANTSNFAYYKFELSGPSTGNSFAPFGGDKTTAVKTKGALGQLVLSPFQPGQYSFRLAVFDHTNSLVASCTVQVLIRERPPTATPPGGGK